MRKTTKFEQYVLDAITAEGYEANPTNNRAKLQFLGNTFKDEYICNQNLERYGNYRNCFKEWIAGLPSSFNIAFSNYDILEAYKELSIMPDASCGGRELTEEQEWKIIKYWFDYITQTTFSLFKQYSINF